MRRSTWTIGAALLWIAAQPGAAAALARGQVEEPAQGPAGAVGAQDAPAGQGAAAVPDVAPTTDVTAQDDSAVPEEATARDAPRGTAPALPRRAEAAPADDAWRRLLAPDLEVSTRAEQAAQHLAAAERALAQDDVEGAEGALQNAAQSLQAILSEGPGAALASELGERAAELALPDSPGADLRPLVAQVRALEPVLPQEVIPLVTDAQRQLERGDRAAAARSLLGARAWIASDLALLPVEQAFARTRAALAEVQAGNLQLARDLVQGVPPAMAELRTAAPLVPVRLRLRAAAYQAQQRNWAQAEMLLNEAGNELVAMRDGASPVLARRIDSLAAQVGVLQERLAAGTQPSSARIRRVAEAAGGVPAG